MSFTHIHVYHMLDKSAELNYLNVFVNSSTSYRLHISKYCPKSSRRRITVLLKEMERCLKLLKM